MGDGDFASKSEGRNLIIRQIQSAQQTVFGCRCPTEAGDGGRSAKGAIPPLLTKAGPPPFLVMCTLCPQPLAWLSSCLVPSAPLLSVPVVVVPLCCRSQTSPAPLGSLGIVQIRPRISLLAKRGLRRGAAAWASSLALVHALPPYSGSMRRESDDLEQGFSHIKVQSNADLNLVGVGWAWECAFLMHLPAPMLLLATL